MKSLSTNIDIDSDRPRLEVRWVEVKQERKHLTKAWHTSSYLRKYQILSVAFAAKPTQVHVNLENIPIEFVRTFDVARHQCPKGRSPGSQE